MAPNMQLNAGGLPFDLNNMSSAQVQAFMQHRMAQQQQAKLAQMQQLGQMQNSPTPMQMQGLAQGARTGFPANMQFPPGMQQAQLQQLMGQQMPMGMYGMNGGMAGQTPATMSQGQMQNGGGMNPAMMMQNAMSQQRQQ